MIILNKLINIFPILFYPFANIVVLFFLGFGLTYLILPKSLRFYWLWLSPWTTIITAIFYFVVMSLFGLSVSQSLIPFVLVLLGIDVCLLIKVKPKFNLDIKRDLILTVLVGMTLILNLSPLIRHDKMLTTVSMGNNDIIAYTTVGDYLKNHSIAESFKTKVELTIDNLLHDGFRWGTPILNSFFLSTLNLEAYKYTYAAQVVLFSLMIPLVYLIFRILFNANLFGLMAVSIFVGFNANLLYMLYHDFFGQVLFWGIEMLLFIFFYAYLDSQEIKNNKFNIYDYILGVLIAVLFFSYHEPAIFMFAPLAVYLLVSFIFRKKIIHYLNSFIRITFITFFAGSTSIINALVFDFQQAFMGNPNQPIGWQLFRSKLPFANPFEAIGLTSIHVNDSMPLLIAIILSVFVIIIIGFGFLKSKNKILTFSYLTVFVFFYYWTAIYQKNFFVYNRALTYTLPLIIILFSGGLVGLIKINKSIGTLLFIILIGLEFYSGVRFNKRFIREHLSVEKSFISILDLKNKNIREPVYSESFIEDATPLWKQIWIGHFLYSKNISLVPIAFSGNQFENRVPDNSLVLISKPTPWFNSLKIIYKDIIWSNDYYQLGHICNADSCLIKSKEKLNEINIGKNNFEDSLLISGWNIGEGESRWANEKESTLRLVTKESYPTSLTVKALSLGKPQEMTVYFDDKLLGQISIDTDWKNYSVPIDYSLSFGVHKIKFVYSQGYRPMDVIPGNLDGRTLYVNFKEIKLE